MPMPIPHGSSNTDCKPCLSHQTTKPHTLPASPPVQMCPISHHVSYMRLCACAQVWEFSQLPYPYPSSVRRPLKERTKAIRLFSTPGLQTRRLWWLAAVVKLWIHPSKLIARHVCKQFLVHSKLKAWELWWRTISSLYFILCSLYFVLCFVFSINFLGGAGKNLIKEWFFSNLLGPLLEMNQSAG